MERKGLQVVSERPMQVGECPLWHPQERALYWIDINGRALHRLDPASGARAEWSLPSEPGCIAWCAAGGIVVALRTGIAMLDTRDGSVTPLLDAPYDSSRERFNDGRCDAAGRLWVGTLYEPRDHPLGALYCVERGRIRDSGRRVTVSNGLAFSADSRSIYHADTTAHRIDVADFDLASGSITEERVFQEFSRDKSHDYGGRPDGAAVDSEDGYWCAMFEGGRILRFSAKGILLQEIDLPVRCPTMVAFGGADLKTLYVTTASYNRPPDELKACPLSGHVLAFEVDVAGRPEYAYQQ